MKNLFDLCYLPMEPGAKRARALDEKIDDSKRARASVKVVRPFVSYAYHPPHTPLFVSHATTVKSATSVSDASSVVRVSLSGANQSEWTVGPID